MHWKKLKSNKSSRELTKLFIEGKMTGAQLTRAFKNTEYAKIIRSLFRTNGVDKTRKLGRRAFSKELA